ncbi:GDP-mannose mannosyl hydrolase [Billgrantia diversa]|uniref:GDP-mannose mannosyl hydrolase n=1 Tax=Halomonas sp. MCCC 1A13316 TaxID=2733487 RepID=UPI0018A62FEA|nr:GDP-mannose mannosyl hydrolase [Halomonas sp. MCCC 1A13316]QOR39076.1 GDP-mannose mannosyl hydrolase [Halomonas sp. MCCC 1A13316]
MDEKQISPRGWLSDDAFGQVVAHTPLISLDFVVTNSEGEWLLGQRQNRPAQGYWFVPGGRVRKNEPLAAAAWRLTTEELGCPKVLVDMRFLGIYEHFYADSVLAQDLSTHYVVLAYQCALSLELESLPRQQHDRYRWWTPSDIGRDASVHPYTQAYLPAVSALPPLNSHQPKPFE